MNRTCRDAGPFSKLLKSEASLISPATNSGGNSLQIIVQCSIPVSFAATTIRLAYHRTLTPKHNASEGFEWAIRLFPVKYDLAAYRQISRLALRR